MGICGGSRSLQGALKQLQKYVAYASLNKKRYHLGTFECEIAAAKAYDEFANRNFGNYKRINFG